MGDRTGPEHDPTAAAAELFDRVAAIYDESVPFFATVARRLVTASGLDGLPQIDRVLDLGAGRGAVSVAVAELLGERVEIVAADVSAQMLAHLDALGLPQLRARRMDAAALDLPDRSCGAVLSSFVLHILPDARAALGEIARVLVPGGLLAFAVPGPAEDGGWWGRYGRIAADYVAELNNGPPVGTSGDPTSWPDLLHAAGFRDVRTETTEVALDCVGPEGHWEWLLSHGSRWLFDALPDVRRAAFRADVLTSLRDDHPTGGRQVIAGAQLVAAR